MIKLGLVIFSTFIITALGLDKDAILKELKEMDSTFPLDERKVEQEISEFKNLDRVSQLLEIKRKLMQALGGVNDLYKNMRIDSFKAKTEILAILRKVQNVSEDPNEAKSVFKEVSENLNHLVSFIPQDVSSQRYGNSRPIRPEAEWAPVEWRPPQGPYQPAPISEWRPPQGPYQPAPSSEWRPPQGPYQPAPIPEWRPPQSSNQPGPISEWRPPYRPNQPESISEWRPPYRPNQPEPISEWRPPGSIPEQEPPSAEWSGPYYPPTYPEPEVHQAKGEEKILGDF